MNVLHRIRRCSGTLSRVNLALFVLVWLSIVIAPCAMAMQAGMSPPEPEHDCPHCPPKPCHEVAPEDCDAPDSLDSPRLTDKSSPLDLLPVRHAAPVILPSATRSAITLHALPPVRAGPRAHLVHVRFNE